MANDERAFGVRASCKYVRVAPREKVARRLSQGSRKGFGMPAGESNNRDAIPLEAVHRVDAICDRFEEQFRAGKQPRIEDYLGLVSPGDRSLLFKELLVLELELIGRDREKPSIEEYRRRFPDQTGLIGELFEQMTEGEPRRPAAGFDVRETEIARERAPIDDLGETVEQNSNSCARRFSLGDGRAVDRKIGRYFLVKRLGRGSQGEVWRAVQVEPIVRTVALKLLPIGTELDDDRVDRLRKEAERASRIGHASIPAIYEFGEASGRTFMAMQFVQRFFASRRPPAA